MLTLTRMIAANPLLPLPATLFARIPPVKLVVPPRRVMQNLCPLILLIIIVLLSRACVRRRRITCPLFAPTIVLPHNLRNPLTSRVLLVRLVSVPRIALLIRPVVQPQVRLVVTGVSHPPICLVLPLFATVLVTPIRFPRLVSPSQEVRALRPPYAVTTTPSSQTIAVARS